MWHGAIQVIPGRSGGGEVTPRDWREWEENTQSIKRDWEIGDDEHVPADEWTASVGFRGITISSMLVTRLVGDKELVVLGTVFNDGETESWGDEHEKGNNDDSNKENQDVGA